VMMFFMIGGCDSRVVATFRLRNVKSRLPFGKVLWLATDGDRVIKIEEWQLTEVIETCLAGLQGSSDDKEGSGVQIIS